MIKYYVKQPEIIKKTFDQAIINGVKISEADKLRLGLTKQQV